MLDSFAQRPATQQKRVRPQAAAVFATQHQADRAIVAEAIASPHQFRQGPAAGIEHRRLVPRQRRGIELIGPLGELAGPRRIGRGHRLEVDRQLQARDEFIEAGRLRPQVLAPRLVLIEIGPLGVLAGQPRAVQHPQMPRENGQRDCIVRHADRQHGGRVGRHFGDLRRVVIEKKDALKTHIEPLGQRPQVSGLRLPVDRRVGESLAGNQHLRILPEHRLDVFRVVLRDHAKQEALRPLF